MVDQAKVVSVHAVSAGDGCCIVLDLSIPALFRENVVYITSRKVPDSIRP